MFDHLKEIELLRYNINTNVERVSEKITKEYLDSTNDTISALIATGFSLIAGNLGDSIYSILRWIPFIDAIVNKMSDTTLRHLLSIPALVSHESGGAETVSPDHRKPGFRS